MSKRTVFTTLTPLPAGISRECVMDTLRSHTEMIDLNPLVEERHPIKPPPNATAEEWHCLWYQLTDRVQYLPGGLMSGKVTYNVCFHDLENGLQTHCYAPMGLNIKGKWTLGGSLPGERIAPVELGVNAPIRGLYLREDVDMSCNFVMTSFVKKTLKRAHASLVDRLLVKAQIMGASEQNLVLNKSSSSLYSTPPRIEYEFPEHSTQSIIDEPEQFRSSASRSSPLPTTATFRNGGRDSPPSYSPALSARSSSGLYGNPWSNSQREHSLCRNSTSGVQAVKTRTLWQALNTAKRSSEITNQGLYPSQSHERVRLSSAWREQVQGPVYNPATYPREFGPVELEAPLR